MDEIKKAAFTLIELLIVLVIIGVLAVLAIPQYAQLVERAKGQEAVINVSAIYDLAQAYYMETGDWPATALDVAAIEKELNIKVIENNDWSYHINKDPYWEVYGVRKRGKWVDWSLGKRFINPRQANFYYYKAPCRKTDEPPPWVQEYSAIYDTDNP